LCDFDHTCGEKENVAGLEQMPDASPLRRDRARILLRGAIRVVVVLPSLIARFGQLF
jgi:hypothetical protein